MGKQLFLRGGHRTGLRCSRRRRRRRQRRRPLALLRSSAVVPTTKNTDALKHKHRSTHAAKAQAGRRLPSKGCLHGFNISRALPLHAVSGLPVRALSELLDLQTGKGPALNAPGPPFCQSWWAGCAIEAPLGRPGHGSCTSRELAARPTPQTLQPHPPFGASKTM